MHQDFIVYSGPEANGKVFHAMIHAKQAHVRGDTTKLYFAAEGTAWPLILAEPDNPMHELFGELMSNGVIAGACENCAKAFGHDEGAKKVVGLVAGTEASFGQIDILELCRRRAIAFGRSRAPRSFLVGSIRCLTACDISAW